MARTYDLLASVRTDGVRCDLRRYRAAPAGPRLARSAESVLSYHVAPSPRVLMRPAGRAAGLVPRGTLAFLDRGEAWECQTDGGPILALMAFFEDGAGPRLPGGIARATVADPLLIELMRLIYGEMRDGNGDAGTIEAAARLLRLKLARLAEAAMGRRSDARRLSADQHARIVRCVRDARGGMPSIDTLAALCGISRRTLERRFGATTGQTLAAFVAASRIERAEALLTGTELSIKQVAFDVGYTSASNFGAAFRRRLGMTPAAYRRAMAV